jgi:hypothetical protein
MENNKVAPGYWSLVSDSTFEGVGYNNHAVNYTGQAGDYFNFSTNSNVYTKEGTVMDTLTYKIVSATDVIITDFIDTCTITGLGGNSLTANNGDGTTQTIVIASPLFETPGGVFWRKVTLSR